MHIQINPTCFVTFEKDRIIEFNNVKEVKPSIIKGENLVKTCAYQAAVNHKTVVYTQYTNLLSIEERISLSITNINSGCFGKEYFKTIPHDHNESGFGVTYPEVIYVYNGSGYVILQRTCDDIILDFISIYVETGSEIIIPPNYSHVIINIGKDNLIFGSLKSLNCTQNFTNFIRLCGEGYYTTVNGMRKNKHYVSLMDADGIIKINQTKHVHLLDGLDFINRPHLYKTEFRQYLKNLKGIL